MKVLIMLWRDAQNEKIEDTKKDFRRYKISVIFLIIFSCFFIIFVLFATTVLGATLGIMARQSNPSFE